jgi:gluconate 5-dehydrogenase
MWNCKTMRGDWRYECTYYWGESKDSGITFHLFHPPLTQTSSAAPLPVPKELKAKPEIVGVGLAKNIQKKGFIICHSLGQWFQIKLSYLFPLKLGGMMTMMTKRTHKEATSR